MLLVLVSSIVFLLIFYVFSLPVLLGKSACFTAILFTSFLLETSPIDHTARTLIAPYGRAACSKRSSCRDCSNFGHAVTVNWVFKEGPAVLQPAGYLSTFQNTAAGMGCAATVVSCCLILR